MRASAIRDVQPALMSEAVAAEDSGSALASAIAKFGKLGACTHCGVEATFIGGSIPRHAIPCGHLVCGACVDTVRGAASLSDEKVEEGDTAPRIPCPCKSCKRPLVVNALWPIAFCIATRDYVSARLTATFADQGDAGTGSATPVPAPATTCSPATEAKAATNPCIAAAAEAAATDAAAAQATTPADAAPADLSASLRLSLDEFTGDPSSFVSSVLRWEREEIARVDAWEARIVARAQSFAKEARDGLRRIARDRLALGSELFVQRRALQASIDGIEKVISREEGETERFVPGVTRSVALAERARLATALRSRALGLPSVGAVEDWMRLEALRDLKDPGMNAELVAWAPTALALQHMSAGVPRFSPHELDKSPTVCDAESHVRSFACARNGFVYAGCGNGGVQMWSWKDGLYRKLVGTRFSDISAVCMMGEKHLVVASERRGVAASVIDLETHRTIVSFFQFDNAGHRGKDMIWLRDRTVLVTTLSSWVYICEFPHSGAPYYTSRILPASPTCVVSVNSDQVAFSFGYAASKARIGGGSDDDDEGNGLRTDCVIQLWRVKTWSLLATFTGHTKPIVGMAMLSDAMLASISRDHTVRLWSTALREPLAMIAHRTLPTGITCLADQTYVTSDIHGDLYIRTGCIPVVEECIRSRNSAHRVSDSGVMASFQGRFFACFEDRMFGVWKPRATSDVDQPEGIVPSSAAAAAAAAKGTD